MDRPPFTPITLAANLLAAFSASGVKGRRQEPYVFVDDMTRLARIYNALCHTMLAKYAREGEKYARPYPTRRSPSARRGGSRRREAP